MVSDDNSILLVENDTEFRRVVSLLLMSAGYSVAETGDWAQAANELKARHYAVILADIRTPHTDDTDPQQICRNLCPTTPVIALSNDSSSSLHDDPSVGVRNWAFACFSKPIDARLLLYAIRHATAAADPTPVSSAPPYQDLAFYWNVGPRGTC